jgi:hypothetical protein
VRDALVVVAADIFANVAHAVARRVNVGEPVSDGYVPDGAASQAFARSER